MPEKIRRLKELGEKIHALRKERKLSLVDVGQSIGMSHNFLSEVERGKKEPSSETIRSLSNFFEVDEDELFSILEKMPLRVTEYLEEEPELQRLLSEVQKKYGSDKIKINRVKRKVIEMYQDLLDEGEEND